MALRIPLILLSFTCFSSLAYTAVPPANVALDRPSESPNTLTPSNVSTLQIVTLLKDTITFDIPDTKISLQLTKFGELLSQAELDLCVIEGISGIFSTVLRKGRDGSLPLNAVEYKYGNVVINIHDFAAPSYRMTYASVASTLRGIALFTSLFEYRAAAIEVYDSRKGHLGTGDFGPIIPR